MRLRVYQNLASSAMPLHLKETSCNVTGLESCSGSRPWLKSCAEKSKDNFGICFHVWVVRLGAMQQVSSIKGSDLVLLVRVICLI